VSTLQACCNNQKARISTDRLRILALEKENKEIKEKLKKAESAWTAIKA
jgi:hypothetical protein